MVFWLAVTIVSGAICLYGRQEVLGGNLNPTTTVLRNLCCCAAILGLGLYGLFLELLVASRQRAINQLNAEIEQLKQVAQQIAQP
jgi:hypothetical protein